MKSERLGRHYKWFLLLLLFGSFFLEQASRQVYSAALPQIKLDFLRYGVTDTQLGMVGTVFGVVFGLMLVASGLASDFFGRKRVLILGVALYSVGVGGSGFAEGIGCMMLFYGVVNAIGQCCIAPPCYSLISQHHVETRSTAMSLFQSAVYFGIILSSVFAGSLAEMGSGGWRWAFWTVGGLGLFWALGMKAWLRDDPPAAAPGAAEGTASLKDAFGALLKKPTAILIALAFGMFIYVGTGFRIWMTAFVARTFEGVTLSQAALHSVLWQYLGAFLGCIGTARLLDRVGVRRPRIRLEVSAVGMLLCIAPIVFVARAQTLAGCCAALFVHGLMVGVYEAAHYPAMFDCIAPRYRSAATGLTGCMAFVIGSMAPAVLGWISDHASMRAAIASLGWFYLVGAVILVPAIFRYFKRDYIPQGGEC